jgi:hypothetical protein
MPNSVDPFIHPIPRKLQADPELRPFFEYFVKWAHQMWKRTGGGEDSVADAGLRETYPWLQENNPGQFESAQSLYTQQTVNNNVFNYPVEQEVKKLTTKTISNEIYTSPNNMFIKAKLKSTIKLPANPSRDCVIYAHNGDGTLLTIDGNGKKINGHDKLFVRRKGNGLQIYYFIEDNEYIAI